MRIAACDPGVTGSLAVVDYGPKGLLDAQVYDLPSVQRVVSGENRSELHLPLLALLFAAHLDEAQSFIIEETHGGVDLTTSHQMGETLGALRSMACVFANCSTIRVRPKDWKEDVGLSKDKEASLILARRLFPALADKLAHKKDHNRAEALLLAHWGRYHATT